MAAAVELLRNAMDLAPRWLRPSRVEVPLDLQIEEAGLVSVPGSDALDYLWFRLREGEGHRDIPGFRVTRLLQLKFIPLEARADPGLLQKMRTALRALYGSRVEFLYLAAGMFSDPPLGIVQCYGASVSRPSLDEACARSDLSLRALQAALAGAYRQVRLEPLNLRMAGWISEAMQQMPHAVLAIGHPDPRETARSGSGMLSRNPLLEGGLTQQQYTLQQNEILFRGMSELEEEFLFLILTSPIRFPDITEMLTGLAEEASTWASLQQGSRGASFGVSLPALLTGAMAQSAALGYGQSQATGVATGNAHSVGSAQTEGEAHTVGHAETSGWTHSATSAAAATQGTAHTVSEGSIETESAGVSAGITGGIKPEGIGVDASLGVFSSQAHSAMHSTADTVSAAHTESHAVTDGTFGSTTVSTADTTSHSDTQSQADTHSKVDSQSQGTGTSQFLSRGVTSALAVGIAPSLAVHNTFEWQFDPAVLVTQVLRTQEALLDTASKEGAFYADVYGLARTERGKRALMGLIPQAFHGTEEVVTGVQTRDLSPAENAYIALHARSFTPSTRIATVPEILSGYMDSTILTLLQLATYTAPGTFEQGPALTVQEATPDFAFMPEMPGEVVLGKQWSAEKGKLTDTLLRLSRERHFHCAFAGDTGFGKTVAAERLAFETTLKWHYRTVVLDFGQGWRKALHWPGLAGRVDIRQLYPGAPRPLRWNILQVPRRMDPGRYRSMLAELFANAGRMGPRQLGFLRRALTRVYKAQGVLTHDPETAADESWGYVRDNPEVLAIEESRSLSAGPARDVQAGGVQAPGRVRIGQSLAELGQADLQALAIRRSQSADVTRLVEELRRLYEEVARQKDQSSRTAIEGLLLRVDQFAEGQMARLYGPGPDTVPIENLGLLGGEDDPWGVVVIEGGAEMDEYPKAALLALLASVLYFDAVARRRESLAGRRFPPMQVFFEEAAKVLRGVSGAASTDNGPALTASQPVAEIFQTMWREGRKYDIFLHVITQTVSELPAGILASCNNGFFVQTKNPNDRDLVMAHIGRSERGVVNTEYKRYLARIPKGYAITKLGYSEDVIDIEPMLVHPLRVPGSEPSDAEIHDRLG
ncbi:MAG: serine-rich protein [Anaerolineales bacterium]|jgi:hypothetical protein